MTAQVTERLIYRNQELSLCTQPLGKFLEFTENPIHFQSTSTANWRGYVGTWRIEEDRLYLVRLRGNAMTDKGFKSISLEDVFQDSPNGVFAHWFSGKLRCPRGGQLEYVHMGYASRFEEDLMFEVQQGVVTKTWVVNNGKAQEAAPQGYGVGAFTTFGQAPKEASDE